LKYYYHDFKPPSFSSIQLYNDFGGISGLEDFFEKRGQRYGFPTEINNSAKSGLIWLAWNSNDFKYFQLFMSEFEDVLSSKQYASAYWQNRFAQFYLKHGDLDKAIEYFDVGISSYPESSRLALMYSSLGVVYLQKNNKKMAVKNYKLAIDIAEKRSDPDLESYKTQLSALRK
jgi:tetratricopeptide (TPR) repeat protein